MGRASGGERAVGLTGARFGGSRRRRGADPGVDADALTEPLPVVAPIDVPVDPAPPAPGVGSTGARFGGSARRTKARAVGEPVGPVASEPVEEEHEVPGAVEVAPHENPEEGLEEAPRVAVRPYVLTGGRTRARVELAIEALVSASPLADPLSGGVEHRALVELCATPRSIAEVAALMRVPLGVARVLVGDLAESGVVAVHETSGAAGPDLALMQRVLAGLRAL